MKYKITDEFEHFDFTDAYISEVQITGGFFHLILANVTILPENSCNRDIREMRTNELVLKLEESSDFQVIREGYKVYNADGKLMDDCGDDVIETDQIRETIKSFADGTIFQASKKDNRYVFAIDAADERSYELQVSAAHDVEEWDRFLNK